MTFQPYRNIVAKDFMLSRRGWSVDRRVREADIGVAITMP